MEWLEINKEYSKTATSFEIYIQLLIVLALETYI